jgi:hypothetical protein
LAAADPSVLRRRRQQQLQQPLVLLHLLE